MAPVAPAGANEVDPRPNRHDPFWDGQEDILKSFSFDYEALTVYGQQKAFSDNCPLPVVLLTLLGPGVPVAVMLQCFHFRCGKDNVRDAVHARHVALTNDGIRYIVDKHPGGCRNAQGEVAKTSRTIPYDKISDCDVVEPGGADGGCACVCPAMRTFYTFNVATGTESFSLRGLDAPYELKKDVWSMKRGQGIEAVDMDAVAAVAPAVASMDRSGGGQGIVVGTDGGQGIGGGNSERLLAQILQCLKEQNSILAQLKK